MLKVNNISCNINGTQILDSVKLEVRGGEIVTLIGPNGSGKTTLFNVINGFIAPTKGEIILDKKTINSITPYRRSLIGITRLWQDVRLFSKLTVLENLIISKQNLQGEKIIFNFLCMRKAIKENIQVRIIAEDYLEKVGLISYKDENAENLSFGQQKLVAIGRLFMNDPKLLLLDEPFAGVNIVIIDKIKMLINDLRKKNKAILMIEHNIGKAKEVSDEIFALDKGKIIWNGNPSEISNSIGIKEAYAGI